MYVVSQLYMQITVQKKGLLDITGLFMSFKLQGHGRICRCRLQRDRLWVGPSSWEIKSQSRSWRRHGRGRVAARIRWDLGVGKGSRRGYK